MNPNVVYDFDHIGAEVLYVAKVIHKKRVTLYKYNPFNFLPAPLIDESCSYNSMIDFVIIMKLKG